METVKTLVKTISYLLFVRFLFYYLLIIFILPLITVICFPLLYIMGETSVMSDYLEDVIFQICIIYAPIIASPFACYLCAKIFGIFKYVESLKIHFVFRLLIVILISTVSSFVLSYEIKFFGEGEFEFIINECNDFCYHIFGLIPAYFLYKYKFFGYLAKKFPFLKKIAYFFSVEFYKSLIQKTKKKISKN